MRRRLYNTIFCLGLLALTLAACGGRAPSTQATLPETGTTGVPPRLTLPPPAVIAAATVAPTVLSLTDLPPAPIPPTATSEPVVEPTATHLPPPTATPVPTAMPMPTATSVPPPTPTAEALYPAWLIYLNRFRDMAGLESLSEESALTLGSALHSQYMVVNDAAISHTEDPSNPFYNAAGDRAAKNGNVFATSMLEADYIWGINFWASAPFHLVPMLAPQLERVGYGNYNEAGGDVSMAAVLDVRSERDNDHGAATYPIFFPKDGSTTWIGRHNLFEWPDPLASCPGFIRPSGPPIVVELGDGDVVPSVGGRALMMGDTPVDTCLFDETTYYNPDAWAQKAGRLILDNQDAIIIIPRQPLIAGETYTAQVDVNGQRYTWQFNTVASAEQAP